MGNAPWPRDPARAEMLEVLRRGGITDATVLAAMAEVPREAFLEPRRRGQAYADRAVPIGLGQTISQPLMVAVIVQALRLRPGDRALDVGTGSGYQAAVMAACGAHVVSIERLATLAEVARRRLDALGLDVEVVTGDGSLGWPPGAPFCAIAVGAAAPAPPVALLDQLAEGGRLVVPVTVDPEQGEELRRFTRTASGFGVEALGACRFVPLVGEQGYAEG